MAQIDATSLPAIGKRHALRPDDPDSCQATVRLSEDDARQVVELSQPVRRKGD